MRHRQHNFGFAIIEVLVVAAAVIGLFGLRRGSPGQTKQAEAITTIHSLRMAVMAFEIDNGRFPADDEGLGIFLKPPEDLKATWKPGGYVTHVSLDPWGKAYQYSGNNGNGLEFNITSAGEDGKFETPDAINVLTER